LAIGNARVLLTTSDATMADTPPARIPPLVSPNAGMGLILIV
jgi:hypothetical protein